MAMVPGWSAMAGAFARLRSYWRGLRQPERLSAEMDEEMRFHLEMEAERLVRERGLDPGEARRQAAIAFGGVEKHKEAGREARGLTGVSGLSVDLKLGWRMLLKSPGLTVVGGLGIAFGTAVGIGFFVFLANFLYPRIPLDEGHRLVAFENRDIEANSATAASLHDVVTWRDEIRSVEHLSAAWMGYRTVVTGDASPRPVRVAEMTAAGFQVARVPPLLGRYLAPADERAGAPKVAVIGHDLWRTRFQSDSEVVGRSILVGDDEHTVVGVMPPGFALPENQELWTVLRPEATYHERGEGPDLFVFGRLAAGATREQAQAELTAIGLRAAAASPDTNAHLRPQVVPYTYPLGNVQDVTLWEAARLQLMVLLVLIAIAVNVAVLVYARTAMRQGEIAVRAALGASRRRIVTQLFMEAFVLSVLGAGLGLGLAHAGLAQIGPIFDSREGIPFWVDYGLQPESVAFAVVLAALSAVIVGVVPGLKATGRKLNLHLGGMGRGASVRLGRAWTLMIVAQVAIAVTVLPTAAHLGYRNILMGAVRTTFPAHEYLTARLGMAVPIRSGMDREAYRTEAAARFADRLAELERRLESEPVVAGVTFEGRLPDRGPLVEVEGIAGPAESGSHRMLTAGVATDYLELLDARVLTGRQLRASDIGESGGGVVVGEAFVRTVLDGGPALGRRLRLVSSPEVGREEPVGSGPWLEIVGVIEDLQASVLDREWAPPSVYYAVAPEELEAPELLVRVRGYDPGTFAPRLRQITAAVDPDLRLGAVDDLATLRNPRHLAMAATLLMVVLLTVLLLSAAGIHALMSLTVTRRRKEIGVRTALGARRGRLLANIFSRAAWQLGLGGLLGSLFGGALLFGGGVTGREAATFLGAVLVLMLGAGSIATMGPARRGLGVQPMEALREE